MQRFNLRRRSYEGQDDFSKALYRLIYEYYDLYNRGLINFGSTLGGGPNGRQPRCRDAASIGCGHVAPALDSERRP